MTQLHSLQALRRQEQASSKAVFERDIIDSPSNIWILFSSFEIMDKFVLECLLSRVVLLDMNEFTAVYGHKSATMKDVASSSSRDQL
ncbi:hypothetical protein HD806DRAFT_537931 [Xylariaceae sp. AK1471]|nr:hypothetical protein HD806DRAFT_537931 [Xylariaceae sp. AK1471]